MRAALATMRFSQTPFLCRSSFSFVRLFAVWLCTLLLSLFASLDSHPLCYIFSNPECSELRHRRSEGAGVLSGKSSRKHSSLMRFDLEKVESKLLHPPCPRIVEDRRFPISSGRNSTSLAQGAAAGKQLRTAAALGSGKQERLATACNSGGKGLMELLETHFGGGSIGGRPELFRHPSSFSSLLPQLN